MTADPLAIAFVNTRSSPARDRIDGLDPLTAWAAGAPALAGVVAALAEDDVVAVRRLRDAGQAVLRAVAGVAAPPPEPWETVTRTGLAAAPMTLGWSDGAVVTGDGDPLPVVLHLLGRALVDLLVGPDVALLHRCQGTDCLRVFLARRDGRRWCDGRICGNRARVAAFARHRRGEDPSGGA
ncbi:ABATE domain-containing protein [Pseudonocardia sp. ICBG1293]|uniref:CGNR zinc finger domain-containing protein n=1 Tax=Pseudonocardia sp. ICBG1293 TaxID=2844382 RepID=UPI001CCDB859|nr:ABATE domain-containing protein [Pseudonocardia sp. ICBG1293]